MRTKLSHMKNTSTLALLTGFVFLFASCSKQDYYAGPTEEEQWMRTHEKGTVAAIDYRTGNYIVETYQGYAVIDSWGSIAPRVYDNEFAWFSNPGMQTIYNYEGNYFTRARVVESWLSWPDALSILDQISR